MDVEAQPRQGSYLLAFAMVQQAPSLPYKQQPSPPGIQIGSDALLVEFCAPAALFCAVAVVLDGSSCG